jgi:hypothetical protein
MVYAIDLEQIQTKELAPYILNIFNEGRFIGKKIIRSDELFRIITKHEAVSKSEWLLFKYKFSAVRNYLRRLKINSVWIETRKYNELNNKGLRVKKFGYSIADKGNDYEESIKVIKEIVDNCNKGITTRKYKINEIKEQKTLREMLSKIENRE